MTKIGDASWWVAFTLGAAVRTPHLSPRYKADAHLSPAPYKSYAHLSPPLPAPSAPGCCYPSPPPADVSS